MTSTESKRIVGVLKTLPMKNICMLIPELSEIMRSGWLKSCDLPESRVMVLFELYRSFTYVESQNLPISNKYHAYPENRIYNQLWTRRLAGLSWRGNAGRKNGYGMAAFSHFEKNWKRYSRSVKHVINQNTV